MFILIDCIIMVIILFRKDNFSISIETSFFLKQTFVSKQHGSIINKRYSNIKIGYGKKIL